MSGRNAAFARTLVLVLPATLIVAWISKSLDQTAARRSAISALYAESDAEAARAPTVYQYFSASTSASCSDTERAALLRAGVQMGGSDWLLRSKWGEASNCCSWRGVTCTSGSVISLSLAGKDLKGTLPTELGRLTSLTTLDINENRGLSGTIPEEIAGNARLKSIFAFGTELSGTLPAALGRASTLQEVELSHCRLSGTIPSVLGSATSLRYIFLESNYLSGVIPTELAALRHLRELELSHNRLSGSVPARVARLPLQHFDVGFNAPGLKGAPPNNPKQGCSGGSERYMRGGGVPAGANARDSTVSMTTGSKAVNEAQSRS